MNIPGREQQLRNLREGTAALPFSLHSVAKAKVSSKDMHTSEQMNNEWMQIPTAYFWTTESFVEKNNLNLMWELFVNDIIYKG